MVGTVVDGLHSRSVARRLPFIRAGDSKEKVMVTLGRATKVFEAPAKAPVGFYWGPLVETWAYGNRFDWPHCFYSTFPYFCPLKLRIFGPASDDFTVEFDSKGKVTNIYTPAR
jgi:hypothetical protein